MRTMLEILEERDRCDVAMEEKALEDAELACAFLAGAAAALEWSLGKNGDAAPAPSKLIPKGSQTEPARAKAFTSAIIKE